MRYELKRESAFGYWYIHWTDGSRSKRRSTGTRDRGQAELTLAAFRLRQAQQQQVEPAEISIAAVLEEYYRRHASKKASAETAGIAIRHLLAFFGTAPVSAITLDALEDYEAKRRPAKNETINRELMVLRAALNRAKKRNRLSAVPGVPALPKGPPKSRVLTRSEAARLLWACRRLPHLALFVRLALYTGARRQAILDLTWERVDFAGQLISYPLPEALQTNKRRAVVPFAGALLTALRRAQEAAVTEWVIEWEGQPVQAIKTAWRKAVARARLPGVTPHTLRHTAATWAAQRVPLGQVAGMLGQHYSTTERVYAKHQPAYLRDAAWALLRPGRPSGAPAPRLPEPPESDK